MKMRKRRMKKRMSKTTHHELTIFECDGKEYVEFEYFEKFLKANEEFVKQNDNLYEVNKKLQKERDFLYDECLNERQGDCSSWREEAKKWLDDNLSELNYNKEEEDE